MFSFNRTTFYCFGAQTCTLTNLNRILDKYHLRQYFSKSIKFTFELPYLKTIHGLRRYLDATIVQMHRESIQQVLARIKQQHTMRIGLASFRLGRTRVSHTLGCSARDAGQVRSRRKDLP
jgi:hypothetical protein